MEVLGALLIASKVMQKGISLLNFGMCQDMTVTKIADLFSTHKSMVRSVLL